jgi:hypothetical protein
MYVVALGKHTELNEVLVKLLRWYQQAGRQEPRGTHSLSHTHTLSLTLTHAHSHTCMQVVGDLCLNVHS